MEYTIYCSRQARWNEMESNGIEMELARRYTLLRAAGKWNGISGMDGVV